MLHNDEAQTAVNADQTAVSTPIEMLGKEILARIEAGEKAKSKSDEHFKSAGLQLIEAKGRVSDFSAFLREHCNGLSRSRAYELIAIGEGKIDEVRTKTRQRTQRHRAETAKAKTVTVSATQRTPKQTSKSEWALREFKAAADSYMPSMDAKAKQQALAYVTERAKS
jgi:hypothetical protein